MYRRGETWIAVLTVLFNFVAQNAVAEDENNETESIKVQKLRCIIGSHIESIL